MLQSETALERCAYELAVDNQEEGVRYLEVRFAPQLHAHRHLDTVMVLKAVSRGLRRARDEFNQRDAVVLGQEAAVRGLQDCSRSSFRTKTRGLRFPRHRLI